MREQTEFGQSRVLLGCLYIDDLCASWQLALQDQRTCMGLAFWQS